MFKTRLPETLSNTRKFTFQYKNLTDTVDVAIQVPDLSENDCELSGEWGPHYKVALKKNQMVRIGYRTGKKADYNWNMLFPSYLLIESPILHSVRKKTPYVYTVHDEVNNLRFELYLDASGCIIEAKTSFLGGINKLRLQRPSLRAV